MTVPQSEGTTLGFRRVGRQSTGRGGMVRFGSLLVVVVLLGSVVARLGLRVLQGVGITGERERSGKRMTR